MSDIVSARRLRKSLLREIDGDFVDFNNNLNLGMNLNKRKNKDNFNLYESKKMLGSMEINKKENKNESVTHDKKILTLKNKIVIKCFFSLLIVFVSLVCKLCFKDEVLNNKYCSIIIKEYQMDYSKDNILEKIEEFSKNSYENLKYVVPERIADKIRSKYLVYVKPYILNFNLKSEVIEVVNKYSSYDAQNVINNNVNIYSDISNISNSLSHSEEVLDGKGGGEPLVAEATLVEESSAVSMMQDDVGQIISKNINMKSPLSGVITSTYGARDQIFEGVNSYHTGIDIATKTGTPIKSATIGKVTKVKYNDKYYGNYVVVEISGVSFRYAHMSKINVTLNENVTQDTTVGLVGSTGMSTGPHLHFEIIINSRTVDPQNLIKF